MTTRCPQRGGGSICRWCSVGLCPGDMVSPTIWPTPWCMCCNLLPCEQTDGCVNITFHNYGWEGDNDNVSNIHGLLLVPQCSFLLKALGVFLFSKKEQWCLHALNYKLLLMNYILWKKAYNRLDYRVNTCYWFVNF